MSRDARDWIGDAYRGSVVTQSYAEQPAISGGESVDLPLFSDEGGDFCEITRFLADGRLTVVPEYRPSQISYSYLEPGAVKAWHLHRCQDDLWFVPPHDRLLVGLLDTREVSPTYQRSIRLTLGTGSARLLLVPAGVAHGAANVGTRPVSLVYFANRPFDREQPDEHRLPFDLLGKEFWSIAPG